jgi:hypothetical protein
MKTYKLVIKINNRDEVESIKETMVADERCMEIDGIELKDFMDAETISLLHDVSEIGIA